MASKDVTIRHLYGCRTSNSNPPEINQTPKKETKLSASTPTRLTPSKRKKPGNITVRPKFFNSRGKSNNPHRATVEQMKKKQLRQLETFRTHAEKKKWDRIHHDHFDWFMFPIEDGSQDQFNVLAGDVQELLADEEWLSRYKESVVLVVKAWGWDVENRKEIDPLEEGMGWTHWDVRLAKIIRSLWIFGLEDYKESLQIFANTVKPNGGLYYGHICLDEVLYM